MGVDGLAPSEEEALERLVGHRLMAWTGFLLAAIMLLIIFTPVTWLILLPLAGVGLTVGIIAYGATDVAEYRVRMIANLRIARIPLRTSISTPNEPRRACGRCGNSILDASTFCERCGTMVA